MGIFDFFKKKKVKQEKSLPKKSAEEEEVEELLKEISKAGGFNNYVKNKHLEWYKEEEEAFEECFKHLSPKEKKMIKELGNNHIHNDFGKE